MRREDVEVLGHARVADRGQVVRRPRAAARAAGREHRHRLVLEIAKRADEQLHDRLHVRHDHDPQTHAAMLPDRGRMR